MAFAAGFAEVDVSPVTFPVRTYLGQQDGIDDPIYAHAAVFCDGTETAAVVSVDVAIIEWQYVEQIRKLVTERCGIAGERVLVCATHNHACPAVVERPGHSKEHGYLELLVEQAADAVVQAHADLAPAELAVSTGIQSRVSHNRRFIMRDGTVITQPLMPAARQDILCSEGVIDPELGVVCLRSASGQERGVLVDFACHACHRMGHISAGYPGVMTQRIKDCLGQHCAVLFLNGACANLLHRNFLDPGADMDMERMGRILGDDVVGLVAGMGRFDAQPVLRTFVVSLANGWLGYIPHPDAFQRQGGHETFPALWSKMETDAGRLLGDRALSLIGEVCQ